MILYHFWKVNLSVSVFMGLILSHLTAAILNKPRPMESVNRHASRTGSYYLNNKHPLWILEDQVQHTQDSVKLSYTTIKPLYYPRPYWRQTSKVPHRPSKTPRGRRIRLPQNYLYANQQFDYNVRNNEIPIHRERWWQRASEQGLAGTGMPTFDSLPGDEDINSLPIFIYNGPKGELILNTMLSARQYPMQEPVPGQVLFPPRVPIFRPKRIVQRFRSPVVKFPEHTFNLTLIPFYAHEAINPRQIDFKSQNTDTTESTNFITTTEATPTVLYAATATMNSMPVKKVTKKRRLKHAKQYAVYRSPHEVHWSPNTPRGTLLPYTPTTPFPLTLASPLHNHRFMDGSDTTTTPTPTPQPQPRDKPEISYRSENDDHFRIVYLDESLEKPPATTLEPTQVTTALGQRFELSKEYYAFPVFTLGKLLKPEEANRGENFESKANLGQQQKIHGKLIENNTDTWFILNSKYKGPKLQRHNNKYMLSSKYTSIHNNARDVTENSIINF